MISRFINFKIFIISLAIGILMVYLTHPKSTIIYVYPTPENFDKIKFKDAANNCFKFEANKVECPKNKNMIKNIPVQN
jgi:hypothetical protein